MTKKICILCGHEEIFPNEFALANDTCPVCKAGKEFIKEAEVDDDEDEETWQQ